MRETKVEVKSHPRSHFLMKKHLEVAAIGAFGASITTSSTSSSGIGSGSALYGSLLLEVSKQKHEWLISGTLKKRTLFILVFI